MSIRCLIPLLVAALLLPGCNSDSTEQALTFQASLCARCLGQRCSSQLSDCNADTGCAGYLSCLANCPLDKGGDAERSCESGCQQNIPSASRPQLEALSACRDHGFGSTCLSCGRPPFIPYSPAGLLTQQCPAARPPISPTDILDPDQVCRFPPGDGGETGPQHCMDTRFPPGDSRETGYQRCVDTYCCQTYDRCYKDNPDCKTFSQCLCACPDGDAKYQCRYECEQRAGTGRPVLLEFAICANYYCRACAVPPVTDLCSVCLATSCLATRYRCDHNPDCLAIGDCVVVCEKGIPSAKCQQDCWNKYPKGQDDDLADTACMLKFCHTACGAPE